jgi:hypothetical protein
VGREVRWSDQPSGYSARVPLSKIIEDRAEYEPAESPCLLVASDHERIDEPIAVIVLMYDNADYLARVLENEHLPIYALGSLEPTHGIAHELLDVELELPFRTRTLEPHELLSVSTRCWARERHGFI